MAKFIIGITITLLILFIISIIVTTIALCKLLPHICARTIPGYWIEE